MCIWLKKQYTIIYSHQPSPAKKNKMCILLKKIYKIIHPNFQLILLINYSYLCHINKLSMISFEKLSSLSGLRPALIRVQSAMRTNNIIWHKSNLRLKFSFEI